LDVLDQLSLVAGYAGTAYDGVAAGRDQAWRGVRRDLSGLVHYPQPNAAL